MSILKANPEQVVIPPTPIETDLTLEEFLESDLTVTVYRSETDIKVLTREDTLTGEDIIEGFSCKISQLFE